MKLKSLALEVVRRTEKAAGLLPAVGGFRPLRGAFSAHEAVNQGRLEGRVLAASQDVGPCHPDSMTVRCGMGQDGYQPWPVFWARSGNALLAGRNRDWRDPDDRVCLEGVYKRPWRQRLRGEPFLASANVGGIEKLEGAWTSLVSKWAYGQNYYHWLLDNLTRLLVREELPEPTRILIPSRRARYIQDTLEMLGLLDVSEAVDAPSVEVERFYFCSPVAMTGAWNPLGFGWLRERFGGYFAAARSASPVFFTRRGCTRIPANLERIEELMAEAGFRVVDCGELSVREQIAMTSAAPAVAGLHGAAMTNVLWVPPDTPVLEIFSPGFLNACYEQIALHGRLNYTHCLNHEDDAALASIKGWLQSSCR